MNLLVITITVFSLVAIAYISKTASEAFAEGDMLKFWVSLVVIAAYGFMLWSIHRYAKSKD